MTTALGLSRSRFLAFSLIISIQAGCDAQQQDANARINALRFMEAGRWGLLDSAGEVIIRPRYDLIFPWSDSVAQVVNNGLVGYIGPDGRHIVFPRFDNGLNFTEGLAAVSEGGQWGYIDKSGKIAIAPRFDRAWQFAGGLASVSIGGQSGYIDPTGSVALELSYEWAGSFSDGLAGVKLPDRGYAVINRSGSVVIGPGLSWVGRYKDGMIPVGQRVGPAFVDSVGNVVIPLPEEVEMAMPFAGSLARVNSSTYRYGMFSNWGYVDKTGELVIDFQFSEAGDFADGLAPVNLSRVFTMEDDIERGARFRNVARFGYIDAQGNVVIEGQYDEAYSFENGIAFVVIGDRGGYITVDGWRLWNLAR